MVFVKGLIINRHKSLETKSHDYLRKNFNQENVLRERNEEINKGTFHQTEELFSVFQQLLKIL